MDPGRHVPWTLGEETLTVLLRGGVTRAGVVCVYGMGTWSAVLSPWQAAWETRQPEVYAYHATMSRSLCGAAIESHFNLKWWHAARAGMICFDKAPESVHQASSL